MTNEADYTGLPKIYSLYDSKGDHYGTQPITYAFRADAVREFARAANDPKTAVGQYPADFSLYEIGEWDQREGKITLYDKKLLIASALEYKSQEVPPSPAEVARL